MATLTTANSVLTLKVPNLFDIPVLIQGYATDDAFATEEVESAQNEMGVDGNLSSGYTPYPVPLTIHLQANSASNNIFDAWIAAEASAREKYAADATILIQGTGGLYTFSTGYLTKFVRMPEAKKILQPRQFQIYFQDCSLAPV